MQQHVRAHLFKAWSTLNVDTVLLKFLNLLWKLFELSGIVGHFGGKKALSPP